MCEKGLCLEINVQRVQEMTVGVLDMKVAYWLNMRGGAGKKTAMFIQGI